MPAGWPKQWRSLPDRPTALAPRAEFGELARHASTFVNWQRRPRVNEMSHFGFVLHASSSFSSSVGRQCVHFAHCAQCGQV